MKKITATKEEVSEIWSDQSGEPFELGIPPVEVKISFSYGSEHDESELTFHFSDDEMEPLLKLLQSKLCSKTKEELTSPNNRGNQNSPKLIALLTQGGRNL